MDVCLPVLANHFFEQLFTSSWSLYLLVSGKDDGNSFKARKEAGTVSGLGTGFPLLLSPLNTSIFPSSKEVKKYITKVTNRALGSECQGWVKTHSRWWEPAMVQPPCKGVKGRNTELLYNLWWNKETKTNPHKCIYTSFRPVLFIIAPKMEEAQLFIH